MRICLLVLAFAACLPALADEGMWTFDSFPVPAVKQTYGVDVTPAWLDKVRLSTVRLSNCTASFVSPQGLMLTNHHCIESCLAELSNRTRSFVQLGFTAADRPHEERCVTQFADVLIAMENITDAVTKSLSGLADPAANAARKQALTKLEAACEQASARSKTGKLKCQAVTLYQGQQYFLYKYKRYDDVRVVFAPEADIANFGGDPDNFQFPRWSFDLAFLRAYENGKPANTPDFFKIDFAGPKPGELVFASGNPGTTSRGRTYAQLQFERDMPLPTQLMRASELRGRYIQFGEMNPADARIIVAPLNSIENAIKVRRKLLDALHDEAFMKAKLDRENAFRSKVRLSGSDPWAAIETATAREREIYLRYTYLESSAGFNSGLFRDARWILRGSEERAKPNPERLREYTDAALPRIEQLLFAQVPVYPELEALTLTFSLERMREWLGPDDPVVRKLLSKESPRMLAQRLIAETQLDDAALRIRLWQGGKSAVDDSRDPMIVIAHAIDAESRAVRKLYDDDVEAPIASAYARIVSERIKLHDENLYPDATFSLRLNYGTVQGWAEGNTQIEPFTYLNRAFERASGVPPFKIPDSWLKVKDQLDPRTPFCLSTNNDIVGGNSGSPLIDIEGKIVGLMFDGNIHSIAGDYWFDPAKNRAVAVHPAIIREALDKVYGAKGLLAELGAQ
jgi:hypothetical protein